MTPTFLVPFRQDLAEQLLAEVDAPGQLAFWAAASDYPPTLALFERWHSDPDVHPHLLLKDSQAVGYGEVWEDPDEGEAELARIFVSPRRRGQGLGLFLIKALTGAAVQAGLEHVWLRVQPANTRAISVYRSAGFVRAVPDQEAEFNQGQPHVYEWMYLQQNDDRLKFE